MTNTWMVKPSANGFEIVADPVMLPNAAAGLTSNIIVPPGAERDRTGPERQRYKDRQRQKIKGKAGDIISKVPIITRPGVIQVPVDSGYEPIWRPGRDGGGGGGGGGKKAGEGKGEYIEMTFDEFVAMVFEDLDLPFMLRKQLATTMVKSHKVKGISHHGPQSRLNKRATAKQRIKRAAGLRNAQPELFVEDFAAKCQQVFDAYIFYSAVASDSKPSFTDQMLKLIGDNVEEFQRRIETLSQFRKLLNEDAKAYRKEAVASVTEYLSAHRNEQFAPYTCHEDLRRRIEVFVYDVERNGEFLPSIEELPFHKSDMRYNRLQEKFDPDSKAVVFLVMDRSGSMSGEPLELCKMYFFLCVMFVRTRYKTVDVVLISHDGTDYLWKTEKEFFAIGAGGGTVAAPAWQLVYNIAETGAKCENTGNSAGPFPGSSWNRYMFHGTDGMLFDGEDVIQGWWKKLILEAQFSYCGYLECGTPWGGYGNSWDSGGQALLGLPAEAKEHLGMGKANKKDDVIKAFKEILIKNANQGR